MINRDDMLELTRRMTPARTCFDRIAGAYMDDMGEISDSFKKAILNNHKFLLPYQQYFLGYWM